MALATMHKGLLARTNAACPVCGHDVAMTQTFNGARRQESFGCYRCGPTVYTLTVGA